MNRSALKPLLLAAGLALPLAVFAQPGPDDSAPGQARHCSHDKHWDGAGHRHERGEGMRHMLRGLDMSDAQREQVRSLMQGQHEQRHAMRQSMQSHHQAMKALLAEPQLDEARLHELTEQRAQMMRAMTEQRVRQQHAILAVLTPEQREKALEQMQRHERHDGHPHHPRHGRPGMDS